MVACKCLICKNFYLIIPIMWLVNKIKFLSSSTKIGYLYFPIAQNDNTNIWKSLYTYWGERDITNVCSSIAL
jgi:hypothetical protein